jgi:uncharacterized phiE125 gp8 family phage protein
VRIDVVTPAASEPVTLDEAKAHLRVTHGSDDLLIAGQISAAREHIERVIGYPIVTTVLRATLDCWPPVIILPRCPIASVDAIEYTDAAGADQVLAPADYSVDLSGGGARVRPAFGKSWPSLRAVPAAVRVSYTAGRAAADVQPSLKAALLLTVGDLYENAEAQVVGSIIAVNQTVDNLLWPHRIVLP